MDATPDYILDIQGVEAPQPVSPPTAARGGGFCSGRRPWIAIHWRCCHVYSRLYRHRNGTAYAGSCPSCGAPIRVPIGPGGTDHRFFYAQ